MQAGSSRSSVNVIKWQRKFRTLSCRDTEIVGRLVHGVLGCTNIVRKKTNCRPHLEQTSVYYAPLNLPFSGVETEHANLLRVFSFPLCVQQTPKLDLSVVSTSKHAFLTV